MPAVGTSVYYLGADNEAYVALVLAVNGTNLDLCIILRGEIKWQYNVPEGTEPGSWHTIG